MLLAFALHACGGAGEAAVRAAARVSKTGGLDRYKVNSTLLGFFLDRYTVAGLGGEDLGIVKRVFPGNELHLFSPTGELWATVRKVGFLSGDLQFFDSEGNLIAKFLGLGTSWLSGPALCEWVSWDGVLLGVTRRIDLPWASARAVAVEDVDGNLVARLYQSRAGGSLQTEVKLDIVADELLTDFRVLVLFAGLRFGTGALLVGQTPLVCAAALCGFMLCLTAGVLGKYRSTRVRKGSGGVAFSPLRDKSVNLKGQEHSSVRSLAESHSLSRQRSQNPWQSPANLPPVQQEHTNGLDDLARTAAYWIAAREETDSLGATRPLKEALPQEDQHLVNSWELERDSENGEDSLDPVSSFFACTCAAKHKPLWKQLPMALAGGLDCAREDAPIGRFATRRDSRRDSQIGSTQRWFQANGVDNSWARTVYSGRS